MDNEVLIEDDSSLPVAPVPINSINSDEPSVEEPVHNEVTLKNGCVFIEESTTYTVNVLSWQWLIVGTFQV